MNYISLESISKNTEAIDYRFCYSEGLAGFITNELIHIDYPENIESVPDAIAAVPFVCNVLPIVWLTNSKLVIPELDEAFYHCINEVKKGYEEMFPESIFLGEIEVGKIVPCDRLAIPGKCAMFYSGGVDSMDTLFRHLDEKPTLLSIWGSDIKYDNEEGWRLVHSAIEEAASHYHLEEKVIHSSFRAFDREGALSRQFSSQLKDSWWHGVKHGIALLGHVAPLAYLHGYEKMYIASSHCPEDGHVRCASNPLIDNHVRYAACQVIHDGFECSRQDKVHNIVVHNQSNNECLPLHVCWESQKGSNCCHCEKCYRTIAAIIIEGGDPEKYGFEGFEQYLGDMIPQAKKDTGLLIRQWTKIQTALIHNRSKVKRSPYWKYVRWIENADFYHPETIQLPLSYRLKKAHGIRGKLAEFRFYQKLHEWKIKVT